MPPETGLNEGVCTPGAWVNPLLIGRVSPTHVSLAWLTIAGTSTARPAVRSRGSRTGSRRPPKVTEPASLPWRTRAGLPQWTSRPGVYPRWKQGSAPLKGVCSIVPAPLVEHSSDSQMIGDKPGG
jgi:hypothetical protein